MRRVMCSALVAASAADAAPVFAQAGGARIDRAEHREYVITDFKTESGVTLPKAKVVYGTYGHLNAARDNVVLLPSHYMANHHGYEWLIGPGLALDTTKLFLVATELFGNGNSSSPSNTPEPWHGPRFPVTTIRDNVRAVHDLLVPLKQYGVSMTRFESRPAKSGQWEYYFYIDIAGHPSQPPVAAALAELQKLCAFYKVLGAYPVTD